MSKGISGKSLIMFLTTFTARYANLSLLFWQPDFSLYIVTMKVLFIAIHLTLVYFVYRKFRTTKADENFRIEFLIGAAALLALILAPEYKVFSLLDTFSLIMESIAMIPQLYLIHNMKSNQASAITTHYIFVSGNYISSLSLV